MGGKTAQRTVTAAYVNVAVPVRGESDKPPNSQNWEDCWKITGSVFRGIIMFYCMSREVSLAPSRDSP